MMMIIDDIEIIDVDFAKSMFSRMKGLMGKKEIKKGLYFQPCNNIHTFFMKVPIDVLYLDKEGKIIYMDNPIVPWKIGKIVPKGSAIIELPEGTINKYNIKIGQKVLFTK